MPFTASSLKGLRTLGLIHQQRCLAGILASAGRTPEPGAGSPAYAVSGPYPGENSFHQTPYPGSGSGISIVMLHDMTKGLHFLSGIYNAQQVRPPYGIA